MDEEEKEILRVFKTEVTGFITDLVALVASFEGKRAKEVGEDLKTAIRHAHSVKGGARLFQVESVASVAQDMESILKAWSKDDRQFPADLAEQFRKDAAVMQKTVQAVESTLIFSTNDESLDPSG